ncbi:MAG TPA: exopolyphosphatase [Acidobacteriota bacterium]|nr:exopolyphosphatase [Acidobacteriota bacterium]
MRLVTRADLDGLTCAVFITEIEKIDSIELIHPQDLTDKRFDVKAGDILANVPYHPNCGKWFDHHLQTKSNETPPEKFDGRYRQAPSTARVVYEYYQNPKLDRFEKLLIETDRVDSAYLTLEDVLDPKDYVLLGYTIDPRSGLGGFTEYFMQLVRDLKNKPIEEIMKSPEVTRRVNLLRKDWVEFKRITQENSRQEGNVVISDFRGLDRIPAGNRFLVYTLFPAVNVSVRVHWGPQKKWVSAVVGHSIFNRTCRVNIGELMSDFGGGGHFGAGATPLKLETADADIAEIVRRLQQ